MHDLLIDLDVLWGVDFHTGKKWIRKFLKSREIHYRSDIRKWSVFLLFSHVNTLFALVDKLSWFKLEFIFQKVRSRRVWFPQTKLVFRWYFPVIFEFYSILSWEMWFWTAAVMTDKTILIYSILICLFFLFWCCVCESSSYACIMSIKPD